MYKRNHGRYIFSIAGHHAFNELSLWHLHSISGLYSPSNLKFLENVGTQSGLMEFLILDLEGHSTNYSINQEKGKVL